MDSVEFLLSIWKAQCKVGEYVALSTKGSSWQDYLLQYDETLEEKLTDWIEKHREKDQYFCPLPFSGPKRSKALVTRSTYLWSDIDDGDYSKCDPSVLWESSPGRFAGLWKLPKALTPAEAEEGSKNLAYYIGADRGGFDLTQVLRIPGTLNFKYASKPEVKLIHFNDRILKTIPQRPIDRWRKSIPRKLLTLLEGKAEVGKRSEILWSLWHELLDLKIPMKDVREILQASEWNKYRGRNDEDERFESEMEKIIGDRGEKGTTTKVADTILRVTGYAELMGSIASKPGWLIEHWWQRGSHGIMAGQPKSFKSTIAMDMFFSIAADKPFLGEFAVHYGGPVLIVQNENADHIMQDRWQKIATSKGEIGKIQTRKGRIQVEWGRDVPIFMINQTGFTLDDPSNLVALEELIQRIRPVAIQLDPLYLMFSGDVNSAQELNPVLTWCLYIKQTYNCAVMLIHHYGKGNSDNKRSGQRMLGSTTLHGWVESATYVEVQDPIGKTAVITLDREFRGAGIYEKVDLHLNQGDFGDPTYSAKIVAHSQSEEDVSEQVVDALRGKDLQSKTSICKLAGLSQRQVSKVVDKLVADGIMYKKGERYGVQL